MKLSDVVAVELLDDEPQGTKTKPDLAAQINVEGVEIKIFNGASRDVLNRINKYLWHRSDHVSRR
ncbi:hypothetical protein L1O48_06090 [Ligilactobacillus equi]|uniref:hypothetical protein n=1 Tax=Ligilactobacillus equi TaxID=137357 RepID=UPI002ED28424